MIRWITENLGTAARDRVVDVSGIEIVDVRHLVDKQGNSGEAALSVVEETVALLRQGKRVVVCCDYGMSRSNAVAAGALAVYQDLPFDDAVRQVVRSTGEQDIKIEVLAVIEAAIRRQPRPLPVAPLRYGNRVLITGGSGFIGKPLIERLSGTSTVVAPGRKELDLTKGSAELNLFVKEHNVNQVVHLASPRIYNSSGAMGPMLVALKNVIDVCRKQGLKLVFASSWEIYSAYRSQVLLAGESLPANPKGPFGLAKWLCERMLEQEKCNQADFDYTIVRLATVYGVGSDKPRFIHRFIDLAKRGEAIVTHRYSNGLPTLDLTHIDDVVSALALIVDCDSRGVYNIGSGLAVSTTTVAEIITQLMNSPSKISHHDIEEFAPNVVMDITRASDVLGWRPKTVLKTELSNLIAAGVGPGTCANHPLIETELH